jgi:formylglycine-generating enzyme
MSLSCSQIVGITDTVLESSGGSASSTSAGGSGKNGVAGGHDTDGGTDTVGADGGAGSDTTSHAGTGSDGGKSTGGMPTGGTSTGGTSTAGSTSGNGGSGGANVLHGPKLINIGVYSVDATEVTVAHYKEFLTAKAGDTSGQIPACSWNTSFYEEAAVPLENDTWPIANVDWCDANAFCAWAGKRLCGAIGGGSIEFADFMEPTQSQWFRACGGPNGQTHPNTSPECNDQGGFANVAPVASFPGCEGFDTGVFDMEGNVSEWVDSCDGSTGKADHCLSAGGNELNNIAYCTQALEDVTRDFVSSYFGFRCCSK